MRRFAVLLFALALAAGCATLKNDQTVCPEFRGLRCMAGESCSMDKSRGCRVCTCDKPGAPLDSPLGIDPSDPSQPR